MNHNSEAHQLLNYQGDIAERIVPGLINFESYFEHIEKYILAGNHTKNNMSVVDLACGAGYGTYYIAKQGIKDIVGFDIATGAVEYASRVYASRLPNLLYKVGDAQEIPISSNQIDFFVSFETLEHIPEPDMLLQEIARVLKPGGKLFLSTPNKYVSDLKDETNPYHINEIRIDELLNKLKGNKLQIDNIFGQGVTNRNSNMAGFSPKTAVKNVAKRFIPDSLMSLLRKQFLLPQRTGIPARILRDYSSNPFQFEDWVSENQIRTSYQPHLINHSSMSKAEKIYESFIIAAHKN